MKVFNRRNWVLNIVTFVLVLVSLAGQTLKEKQTRHMAHNLGQNIGHNWTKNSFNYFLDPEVVLVEESDLLNDFFLIPNSPFLK